MKKLGVVLALLALISIPLSSLAQDGVALYKTKCGMCHGAAGEGKPAVKAPALKGTSLTVDQIVTELTKGDPGKKAPHAKPVSGLTADQAKAVAEFVKTLK